MTLSVEAKRSNLQQLSDYLIKGVTAMEFDMVAYCQFVANGDFFGKPVSPENHECGTVACALGHGPAAGIAPMENDQTWQDYYSRHFRTSSEINPNIYSEWEFLFSCVWADYDNTPEGAGHRIKYFLENGFPILDEYGQLNYNDFKEGWWKK